MSIYGMDSPYSRPELVGYDAFGRPVYNRNARQKTLGMDPSLGGLGGFGGPTTTTTESGGGGVNPFGMARQAVDLAKTGRDAYNYGSELFSSNAATPTISGNVGTYGSPGGGFGGGLGGVGEGGGGAAAYGVGGSGGFYGAPGGGFGGGLGAAGEGGGGAAAFGLGGATGSYGALGGGFGGGLGGAGMGGGGAAAFGVGGTSGAAGTASLGSTLGAAAPPLLAMYAMMQLGGAFDGPVPSMGAGGYGSIDPNGVLGDTNIANLGTGTQATPEHFAQAQRIADTFKGLDLKPWAGQQVMADFGADKDIGMNNPLYNAQFLDLNGGNPLLGGRYGVATRDYDKLLASMKAMAAAGPGGLASMDPHQLMALMLPDLDPSGVDYQVRLRGAAEDR